MKKLFCTITLIICFSAILKSYGQTVHDQNNVVADSSHIQKIQRDLNIDETLAIKVYLAMQTNDSLIKELIKNKTLDPREKQKRFKMLNNEREQKVNALLSPEQQERLSRIMLGYISKRHFVRRDSLAMLKNQEELMRKKALKTNN
jgi:hypothetical protein